MNTPSSPMRPFPVALAPNAPASHTVGRAAGAEARQIGRVRGVVWGILALTIVLALAFPVGVYCRLATAALSAQVCVWPSTPRADAPARLLVILAPGRDSADAQTPQAQAQAQLAMLSMAMGAQWARAQGSPNDNGVFVAPLTLNMAGAWQAQVNLQTPGRPDWRGSLDFTALGPAQSDVATGVPPVSQLLLVCQAKGATA